MIATLKMLLLRANACSLPMVVSNKLHMPFHIFILFIARPIITLSKLIKWSIFRLREQQLETFILRKATTGRVKVIPFQRLCLIRHIKHLIILAVEQFAVDEVDIYADDVLVLATIYFTILGPSRFWSVSELTSRVEAEAFNGVAESHFDLIFIRRYTNLKVAAFQKLDFIVVPVAWHEGLRCVDCLERVQRCQAAYGSTVAPCLIKFQRNILRFARFIPTQRHMLEAIQIFLGVKLVELGLKAI